MRTRRSSLRAALNFRDHTHGQAQGGGYSGPLSRKVRRRGAGAERGQANRAGQVPCRRFLGAGNFHLRQWMPRRGSLVWVVNFPSKALEDEEAGPIGNILLFRKKATSPIHRACQFRGCSEQWEKHFIVVQKNTPEACQLVKCRTDRTLFFMEPLPPSMIR